VRLHYRAVGEALHPVRDRRRRPLAKGHRRISCSCSNFP
jgi:hypothetical protein